MRKHCQLGLIFCVDVHMELTPPVRMRPPEPHPYPLRVDVMNDGPYNSARY